MVSPALVVSLMVGAVAAQRGRPTRSQPQTQTQAQTSVRANPTGTQSLYGQCGGQTWDGPRACPTGAYCRNTDSNIWYSQCVPIAGANPPAAGSSAVAEIRTLTTIFTVDGPYPTVISTQITYLQPRPTRTTSAVEVVTVTLIPDEPCEHEYYC